MKNGQLFVKKVFRTGASFSGLRLPWWMQEWVGPALYGAGVLAITAIAIAGVMMARGSSSPLLPASHPATRTAATRPAVDTPETAPQLSPIYPTTVYDKPASTGVAARARELAREGGSPSSLIPSSQLPPQVDEAEPVEPETTGAGSYDSRRPRWSGGNYIRPDIPR